MNECPDFLFPDKIISNSDFSHLNISYTMSKHALAEKDEPPGKRHHTYPALSGSHTSSLPRLLPPFFMEPWKATDIPSQLPPLPKIHDAAIEKEAFRHPGYAIEGPSYERLEWLGDSYIEMIATHLISQTFTRTTTGRCCQLRELLVRNTNLAEYFRKYDMTPRARIPPDISMSLKNARGRSSDKDLIKIQGDIFEAYVAAVVVSDPANGIGIVAQWLRTLFSMTIKDEIIRNEDSLRKLSQQEAPKITDTSPRGGENPSQPARDMSGLPPKDQLARLIGAKGIQIRYKDMPGPEKDEKLNLPLFTVGVYLTGWGENDRLLGTGTALGKKEAGQKAATVALESKDLMSKYESQKRAHQASLNPQKEKESG